MKVIYTFESFEMSRQNKRNCEICGKNKSTGHIITRNTETNKPLGSDCACENCRVKITEDKQFEACLECGRLVKFNERDEDCLCMYLKEKYGDDEKEVLPETHSSSLEKQIHELSLKQEETAEQLEQEKEHHLAGIKATQDFIERQHEQETTFLRNKSRRLSDENKKLKSEVEKLRTQLLGVDELVKKARRLSNENRTLKGKVEGLELEVEKYKEQSLELKPGISQLKADILEMEAKLEQMISGTELQSQIEISKK